MVPASRDRDDTGRPRNARPRDALGRPLTREAAGQPQGDDRPRPAAEALAAAQELINAGRPFHAHEVLEAAWKTAPPAERDLWQGLAQIAVGLTHALRGNARGAVSLLQRGADRLAGYSASGPYGIDVAGLRLSCAELAARIEQRGAGPIDPGSLHLRLRRPDATDLS